MAKREVTEAVKMLNELRIIPKLVSELKQDLEATRTSLISSPKWSDMKVTGGIKRSQDDKYVDIIDTTSYHQQEIDKLLKRKDDILEIVNSLEVEQRLLIITSYCNCKYPSEAIGKLGWGRNKYYSMLNKSIESIDLMLEAAR